MIKISFKNIKNMIDSIKEHTEKNFSYVISQDNLMKDEIGWFCPKTNSYFFMNGFTFSRQTDNTYRLSLDTSLKRKIAAIYLSNCNSDKEYNLLIEKINKFKSFW